MTAGGLRTWLLRAAHVALPFAMSWHLSRSSRAGPTASGDAQTTYDLGTAALAAVNTSHVAVPASAAVIISSSLTSQTQHWSRVLSTAAAEEVIWRARPGHVVASTVAFAALHAAAEPRRWPYHLLTGAALTTIRRRWGLAAAIAAHTAHNLAVIRYARKPDMPFTQGPALEASQAW